jgi:hypothetical protein
MAFVSAVRAAKLLRQASERGVRAVIDVITKRPIHVTAQGTSRPYIRLAVSQLDEVQRLLDSHGIRYWVGEHFLSFNGGPEKATIDLGHGADAGAVQAIFDSVR